MRAWYAALLLAACAPAVNLTDPAGPRYGSAGRTERTALARATPAELKVVSFNIKYGREIERAIEVLRAPPLRAADIILLQEVDEEDAARIAAAFHLEYVYYPATIHPVENRHFGAAVLSAWPLERDWKLVLPHRSWGRGQQRSATTALLRTGTARVRVYSTHLEVPLSITPAGRREQVERILCDAASAEEAVIIGGDFNGPDVAWLFERAGYTWATRDVGATAALFRADHIFARGLAPADDRAAGVVEDVRGASDHRPVWARLLLSPRDSVPAAGAPARDCR